MSERHNYEYQVDLQANTAAAKVVRFVGTEKRVLEIGAGPGSITRLLSEHGKCTVTAIELDATAIEKLTPFCERVFQLDLNKAGWPATVSGDGKFQVVVAADVLEHLYDPLSVLIAMKDALSDDGCIVVSLPHVANNAIVACLLEGDFDYQNWGLLDKTHIRFFGIHNMQRLFENAGLKIVDAEFVVRPPEQTEFAHRWRRLPAELTRNLAFNRFGSVYQVVIKAKLQSSAERSVVLSALSVPVPDAIASNLPVGKRLILRVKLGLLPYLSAKSRTRIRLVLQRLGIKI